MLKRIRVKNFVHFDAVQDLTFDVGPHFFIGQNASGKTCMFEAVRRCMSTAKNMGASTSHNQNEPSIILCDFQLACKDGDTVTQVMSGVVRLPLDGQKKDTRNDPVIKFVLEHTNDSTSAKLYLDLVKKDRGKCAVNEEMSLEPDTKKKIMDCLMSNNDTLFDDLVKTFGKDITEKLQDFRKKGEDEVRYEAETGCERYLIRHIDSSVIITFPVRSIAAVQWTESETYVGGSNRDENRRQRKQDLPERSEIVSWYYKERDKHNITKNEMDLEDQYFRKITANYDYGFEKLKDKDKENEIVAFENEHREKRLPLEKVPEGFFEAKNCSILLAIARFQTICLEEAGRGMHPQMIERMRDLVLKTIKNKVIIITSHVPSFIASWNVPRIFFFRRIHGNQAEAETTFKVVLGNNGLKKTVGRLITDQVCSMLFFARRVLFVEGENDNNFMTKLRYIMLNDDGLTNRLIEKCLEKKMEAVTFYKFMAPLHIISLNGHKNKKRFHDISDALSLEHYFLLDHDAVVDVVDKSEIPEEKQEEPPKLVRSANMFDLLHDVDDNAVVKDVAVLEERGVFVWRKSPIDYYKKSIVGTIEGALVELMKETDDSEGSSKQFLVKNHINLKWDESAKKKKQHKLFSDPNVTDEIAIDVVKKVLEHCEMSKNSDMSRFIRFLFETASKQEPVR